MVLQAKVGWCPAAQAQGLILVPHLPLLKHLAKPGGPVQQVKACLASTGYTEPSSIAVCGNSYSHDTTDARNYVMLHSISVPLEL